MKFRCTQDWSVLFPRSSIPRLQSVRGTCHQHHGLANQPCCASRAPRPSSSCVTMSYVSGRGGLYISAMSIAWTTPRISCLFLLQPPHFPNSFARTSSFHDVALNGRCTCPRHRRRRLTAQILTAGLELLTDILLLGFECLGVPLQVRVRVNVHPCRPPFKTSDLFSNLPFPPSTTLSLGRPSPTRW